MSGLHGLHNYLVYDMTRLAHNDCIDCLVHDKDWLTLTDRLLSTQHDKIGSHRLHRLLGTHGKISSHGLSRLLST